MKKILGIDEAGRGPIIGDLVIAGILIKESEENLIKEADDSKKLSKYKRKLLFKIFSKLEHKLIVIPPKEIDEAVESKETNLNWLEANKTAEIINELKPDKAIIDCPSNNTRAYREYLRKLLINKETELIVENKSDSSYKIVGAASILAKVTRDKRIKELEKKYGKIGSGYPSDPITQKFLKENWDRHPEIFRKSWLPYKNISSKKFQKGLDEF